MLFHLLCFSFDKLTILFVDKGYSVFQVCKELSCLLFDLHHGQNDFPPQYVTKSWDRGIDLIRNRGCSDNRIVHVTGAV